MSSLPKFGDRVIYFGSLTEYHGEAIYLGDCLCDEDECYGVQLQIQLPDCRAMLSHVGGRSYRKVGS